MYIGKVDGSYEYEMKGVFRVLGQIYRLTVYTDPSWVYIGRGVMILIA